MATALPLQMAEPVRLEDFPPEVQARIRAFEGERAAGTFVGIPGEQAIQELGALEAATAKVAAHFRARGLDATILEDGTPEEVRAYCAATFEPGDGPAAWLTPGELRSFFSLHGAPPP
jgi:hypothetical protein